jgi:hypothetical protein
MTKRNPNVFYEVGYPHALGKIVLLLTQDSKDILFDLKHRQHTVCGGKIETLRKDLATKLHWAISESKKRAEGTLLERFCVRIQEHETEEGLGVDKVPKIAGHVSGPAFGIPLRIKNESAETFHGISHVYLFVEEKLKLCLPSS